MVNGEQTVMFFVIASVARQSIVNIVSRVSEVSKVKKRIGLFTIHK